MHIIISLDLNHRWKLMYFAGMFVNMIICFDKLLAIIFILLSRVLIVLLCFIYGLSVMWCSLFYIRFSCCDEYKYVSNACEIVSSCKLYVFHILHIPHIFHRLLKETNNLFCETTTLKTMHLSN